MENKSTDNTYLKDISRRLHAMASAGLLYSKDKFDIERYNEIIDIAADLLSHQTDELGKAEIKDLFEKNDGYPTPKCALRLAIFDEEDRILLVRDYDGKWTLPGGWCEYDHTLRENAIKEAKEESGLDVEPYRVVAVLDHKRSNNPNSFFCAYNFLVLCMPNGGEFVPNIETTESQYFRIEGIPEDYNDHKCRKEHISLALEAKHAEHWECVFD